MLHRWRSQFFFSGIKAGEVTDQLFFNDWWNNAHGKWVLPEPKPKKTRKQKEKWPKKKKEQLLLILLIVRTLRKKRLLFSPQLMMHGFAFLTQLTHFVFFRLCCFRFFERYMCCWGGKKSLLLEPFSHQNFFSQAHWSELCYKKKRGDKSFFWGSANGYDWIFVTKKKLFFLPSRCQLLLVFFVKKLKQRNSFCFLFFVKSI